MLIDEMRLDWQKQLPCNFLLKNKTILFCLFACVGKQILREVKVCSTSNGKR